MTTRNRTETVLTLAAAPMTSGKRFLTSFLQLAIFAVCISSAATSNAGLVGHWDLDEATGGTATDSISGNDGIWQNGAMTTLTWTPGQIGGAARLTDAGGAGANNFFQISTLNQFVGAGGLTFSAWINPVTQTSSGYNGIFMTRTFNGQSGNSWGLAIEGSAGAEHLDSRVDGPGIDSPNGRLSPGGWIHVAMVWDGTARTHTQYVNGVQTNSTSVAGDGGLGSTIAAGASGPWYIGYDDCCNNVRDFDGMIDDVAVWDEALLADDINTLYTNGLAAASFRNRPQRCWPPWDCWAYLDVAGDGSGDGRDIRGG